MLWLQRALGALGGMGCMGEACLPSSWNSCFPGSSAPCFVQGEQHLGLGPWPSSCPQDSQPGRETVLEWGVGTARPSALSPAPLVNMHPAFPCPPWAA